MEPVEMRAEALRAAVAINPPAQNGYVSAHAVERDAARFLYFLETGNTAKLIKGAA